MKNVQFAASLLALAGALAGCGGGGEGDRLPRAIRAMQNTQGAAQVFPVQMMTRLGHSGPIEMDDGFNASAITTDLQDIAESVRAQAAAPVDVALTFRYPKDITEYDHLEEYWREVQKHPNIKWVYLYDEMFWDGNGIEIGRNEQAITRAARMVHSVGLKAAVSILPEVILDPKFAFGDINVFDVIAVDVYPSLGIDWRTVPSYAADPNLYFTMISQSVRKLRDMGYRGEVWYIFQAFGDPQDRDLAAHLQLQREALARAPSIGVTGAVAYGFYDQRANLPKPLYPAKGTALEPELVP